MSLEDSIKTVYDKGFADGVLAATSQVDKDRFIEGQLNALDLVLTTFSHAYTNQDVQMVLQAVAKMKKEIENTQPKEMDIV